MEKITLTTSSEVGTNPIARKVKIADLKDNLDSKRLGEIREKDLRRMERYRKTLEILKENE